MKTAISIPDELFEAADRMAKLLGVSRSEFYKRALYEYLESQGRDIIQLKLNEVYTPNPELGRLDPVIEYLQGLSSPEDDW